ncbi:uncharacterized [Tachysurus ichikawai]
MGKNRLTLCQLFNNNQNRHAVMLDVKCDLSRGSVCLLVLKLMRPLLHRAALPRRTPNQSHQSACQPRTLQVWMFYLAAWKKWARQLLKPIGTTAHEVITSQDGAKPHKVQVFTVSLHGDVVKSSLRCTLRQRQRQEEAECCSGHISDRDQDSGRINQLTSSLRTKVKSHLSQR